MEVRVFHGIVESGSVSPSVEEKLRDLQNQWAQTILDHVQRLKAAFGEARFQRLDEFIQESPCSHLPSRKCSNTLRTRLNC
jgi:hypothetical protein